MTYTLTFDDAVVCGRALHHVGLLVHRIHLIRQSGGDHCAFAIGYICRNSAGRRAGVHRGRARRNDHGRHDRAMALANRRLSPSGPGASRPWINAA